MLSMIPTSNYGPGVRIGNWLEDLSMEQEKMRTFKNLRGQLLVEKTRRLFDNFHKVAVLDASKENVRFGAVMQLRPAHFNVCEVSNKDVISALSIVITERVVRHSQTVNEECELSVAPSTRPCLRNSFRIISVDNKDRTGEYLKYGQHFRLQCMGTTDNIYLYSTQKAANLSPIIQQTYESFKYGEINLPVGLVKDKNCGPGTDIPNAFTNWFCQHSDRKQRFETNDTPLPCNKPLVITHAATNKNLAAVNHVVQTLFGPEFLVSVQNYVDKYKRDSWQNLWMICGGHQLT